MEAVQKAVAEAGASQQAAHFKAEADGHAKDAANWLKYTRRTAYALGGYAVVVFIFQGFSAVFGWMKNLGSAESLHLLLSKALVFGTLAAVTIVCSRVYLSHLHNAVVNRQRQNSLMTFKALVEAAGQQENRDIILTKAADSIFAPQPTGFSKADGAEGAATSVISLGSGALRGTPS